MLSSKAPALPTHPNVPLLVFGYYDLKNSVVLTLKEIIGVVPGLNLPFISELRTIAHNGIQVVQMTEMSPEVRKSIASSARIICDPYLSFLCFLEDSLCRGKNSLAVFVHGL